MAFTPTFFGYLYTTLAQTFSVQFFRTGLHAEDFSTHAASSLKGTLANPRYWRHPNSTEIAVYPTFKCLAKNAAWFSFTLSV